MPGPDVPRETSIPIAYSLGAWWFCLTCGPQVRGAAPQPESSTFSCYRYDCDECGKLILPIRDVPGETENEEKT